MQRWKYFVEGSKVTSHVTESVIFYHVKMWNGFNFSLWNKGYNILIVICWALYNWTFIMHSLDQRTDFGRQEQEVIYYEA